MNRESRGNDGIIRSPGSRLGPTRLRDEDGQPPHLLGHRRQFLHLIAGAAALPAMSRIARAQACPSRPVRWIVGFPPGGGADTVARIIAPWLSERLAQQVVIENRPGAGTNIAVQAVVNSPPDGYTLLWFGLANVINVSIFPHLPFDFLRDITPVCGLVVYPMVLVAHPSFPANTVAELIAHAKAHPGKVSMASFGIGLRPCHARHRRQRGSARCQMQKLPTVAE